MMKMRRRRADAEPQTKSEGGDDTHDHSCTSNPHIKEESPSIVAEHGNGGFQSCYKVHTISIVSSTLQVLAICIPLFFFIGKDTMQEYIKGAATTATTATHLDGLKESTIDHTQSDVKKDEKCSVYLAPSSLPEGGMGMFTTQNVRQGEIILPADGPQIPIIDPDDSEESSIAWGNLFRKYWWESGMTDPGIYDAEHVAEYQITCGALPNSHVLLDNLWIGHPAVVPFDDTIILDRKNNPGTGAISNYMGRDSIASVDINAGEEIFLTYPDEYMQYISEIYKIPSKKHYKEAGMIMTKLFAKYDEIGNYNVWKVDDFFLSASELVRKLLPKSQTDLDRVLAFVKTPQDPDEMAYALAKEISVLKRSVDWIERNGLCLDNIVPKISTNPRAGQGAFTQRFIAKGDVVVPAPLLQITNRDAIRIPAFMEDSRKWQLLLNYCLGHNESSLLLCPNTNAILVNHCSTRRPDLHPCSTQNHEVNEPNAEFRWAEWDANTKKWLGMTIEDMELEEGRGLTIEIVATRDILEGEEVFVDYGMSWEEAWDQHVSNWKPPDRQWASIKKLNEELGPLEVVSDWNPTRKFDLSNPIFTGCFYFEDHQSLWDTFQSGDEWQSMPSNEVISKYVQNYGDFYEVDENATYADGDFWPCAVIGREAAITNNSNHDTYTVRIFQSKHHENTRWTEMNLPRIISNYPRSSIRHFYLPYNTDIHLPGVFRHHIELPNHLLQSQWRDRM